MKQTDQEDWRLACYDGCLNGNPFTFEKFVSVQAYDHTHCIFCWQKITDLDIAGSDKDGYRTVNPQTGQERWVCKACFRDFQDVFAFKLD